MDEIQRSEREVDFWGHHIRSLDDCVAEYHAGPDPNTRLSLDALEPLSGLTVLDFACGQGLTSAWLAGRGASVVGLDVTPASIERARQLCGVVGVRADFVCGDLTELNQDLGQFDRVYGRFALHHVDLSVIAPLLHRHLAPTGWGSFLETTFTNPLLKLGRVAMVGRFGVARYGTLDERPLGRGEFELLRSVFGSVDIDLAQLHFLRMIDRNLLRRRWPVTTRWSDAIDDALARSRRLHWLGYEQVVVVGPKPPA